ncbi:myocyte-specific enhancer factor 2A isoform X3 [Lingula anatina]|uniref:Myocyte-specific enhancer factor 2A isoform X3 n=1 Tax=Lingula anatina TaxID=7574 RepID=A0A1S3HGX4_LINAN|nr:myocyte-specific enhancer factor 2A isoform X3 [Lingula anatina]|eukprot:XP_013384736.1 myocyte-specific enhancer factor 2A isoform X3 [Lingula anatina]
MGRKKIQISRIGDERNRQVTFTKRKFGLMKKAYELSVLCDCEIALIIFNSANKLFQYASTDMDKVLLKYTEYNEPHESRTNKDIIEALNKKEHKGCESPEPDAESYTLTPRTEERYQRINQEFQDMMMKQTGTMRGGVGGYQSMPVSVPIPATHNSGFPNHQQSAGMISNTLMPPQAIPQSSSPRPSSTGGMLDLSQNNYPSQSTSPNPAAVGSTSPGGNMSRGSPPSTQGRPNLRVVIPSTRGEVPLQPRTANNTLATPVVSLATPSLPGTGPYPSGLPTSFAHTDFHLNSADLSAMQGFNTPGGLLPSAWGTQGPLSAAVQAAGLNQPPLSTPTSIHHMATLSVNTGNKMNIKSEPISPSHRESHTPSGQHLRPPSAGHMQGHMSPNHMGAHSNASSPGGSTGGGDYDGPNVKRSRMNDGWSS